MGWVSQGTPAPQPWYKWQPRFLALKGAELFLFDSPPVRNKIPLNLLY